MSMIRTDAIVVGTGLAGLAAARRLSERGKSVILVDHVDDTADLLEMPLVGPTVFNREPTTGSELFRAALSDLQRAGVLYDQTLFVESVEQREDGVVVHADTLTAESNALIFAPNGTEPGNHPALPPQLAGFGLSYSAGSDAPFFRQARVAVYGQSFRAIEQAWIVSRVAAETHILLRDSVVNGNAALLADLRNTPNVTFYTSATVTGARSADDKRLQEIRADTASGPVTLPVVGIFIANDLFPEDRVLQGTARRYPIVPAGLAAGVAYWKHSELVLDGFRAADVILSGRP